MKTKSIKVAILFCCSVFISNSIFAQTDSIPETPPNKAKGGAEKFLFAGEAFTEWQSTAVKGVPTTNSFGGNSNSQYDVSPLGLMLMPLVKLSDRLFLDAQIQVQANTGAGGGAGVSLNEAIIYYRLLPYMYVFAGNFQPRCGLYNGILDDFTNRFGSSPVGMSIGFQTQSGLGLQGGFQAGYSKFNYQLYVANGPQLVVDSTGATNGQLTYANYTANNTGKAIGGSLGFLPFSNSSLEIGVSGQYTAKTGAAGSPYENISNSMFAAYLNYFKVLNPFTIRVVGQYDATSTQSYTVFSTIGDNVLVPSFTNNSTGWYLGATLRASGIENEFVNHLELGGRYSQLTLPSGAAWGSNGNALNQTTLCLTYWLTWKTPINLVYDVYTQSNAPTQKICTVRGMWFF